MKSQNSKTQVNPTATNITLYSKSLKLAEQVWDQLKTGNAILSQKDLYKTIELLKFANNGWYKNYIKQSKVCMMQNNYVPIVNYLISQGLVSQTRIGRRVWYKINKAA